MLGSASPVLILSTSGVGDSADPPVLTSIAANCTEQLLHTANLLALGLSSLHVQRKSLSVKERTGCPAMIKAAPPPR